MTSQRETRKVSDAVFRAVYDSPASLPGCYRWVTPEEDVRKVEELLGMEAGTIGAPLWVSGDSRQCRACGREPSWLDIVSSALDSTHERAMIAEVILGEHKYVNTEAPKAIAGLLCHGCRNPITDLRSFKCHNWAYAFEDLQKVLERIG
ncbi:hypothetical protein [Streptomyces sp. NBC_01205]|uniref:hypothetical protein n=1 Tax=Streptomyces sp. NBC_01205 TaxID=2903771 RepID=UPI002E15B7DD|nr:hypothetical protein OG573_36225 [Streptomyces sp. NBC_01205]